MLTGLVIKHENILKVHSALQDLGIAPSLQGDEHATALLYRPNGKLIVGQERAKKLNDFFDRYRGTADIANFDYLIVVQVPRMLVDYQVNRIVIQEIWKGVHLTEEQIRTGIRFKQGSYCVVIDGGYQFVHQAINPTPEEPAEEPHVIKISLAVLPRELVQEWQQFMAEVAERTSEFNKKFDQILEGKYQ